MDTMFVGWVPGSQNEPRKTAPRLHHKKSRTGCQQCRARRVKCNEVHPVCGSCSRHQTTCVWGRPGQSPGRSNSPNSTTKPKPYTIRPKLSPHLTSTPSDWDEPPESRDRRLTELHLLHHYMAITSLTMNVPGDRKIPEWSISIPKLAFKHNSLLYAIYTFTSMHIAKLDPTNTENIAAYQRYLGLTLREHRDEVGVLSRANADAACLTSSFLRVINFALLQDRGMEPYTPPCEWLQMSSSTGRGLNVEAWKFIADDTGSIMRGMIRDAPGIKPGGWLRDDSVLFRESNRQDLLHLLRRTESDLETEPWNPEIQEAYETTTSYIGSIQMSIKAREQPGIIFRRLIIFPTVVQTSFIELVKEQRPRALVVLAHFFAFLADFREFWWIGDCGRREVMAIERVLSEEWRELMIWPLQAVEDAYVSS
ncbi:related to C6 transcription factor [Phialocephala subalpina]|uniref:Related to C6 transcription factor n=1 Tax=Phialocephala subalpina TaxID=576137 RepID=A0A1L7XHW2_9HELO|nr:related to C6 transcription factor [Phialocephala subalpina]